MIYIDSKPNPSGAYPNPKNQPFPGCIALDEKQAAVFFEYNGFVIVQDGVVTPNVEAWEEWKASLPEPVPVTPAEQREEAYNTEKIIEWEGKLLTVTEAAQLWQYYAAEGNEKADTLTGLIAEAKTAIREKYPDEA